MIEIGVDIGGTFTDVVCREPDRPLRVMKVPTSRADPSRAVLEAVARLKEECGIAAGDIGRFVHGTTVATNAVLERKGPRIGLLTTEGFRDILEIGRQMRHKVYKVVLEPEEPVFLAEGAYRMEIPERIGADGSVVKPLDEVAVRRAADALVANGAEGIAICFLFSFLNPAHEARAAEIIREGHPDVFLSLSSEVDPAFREYERTVVTALDAYIKPVVETYLGRLREGLGSAGVACPLQIMQSRGGIADSGAAKHRPVRLFLSGPAGGVIGAQDAGAADNIHDLISVDIGGTSSDISLIRAGRPLVRPEGLVAGYQVRVPMVDVNAIGAGGGSIAWIDSGGGLRVGPHSAGSEPGPACYDRGGVEPTVTDASIVLGYIDPDYFAGGRFALAPELAHRAIEEKIARPLNLSVTEAALGIHRVVTAQMTEGIRLVSIRQGFDPREFTLLPLGGSGGIHACALADELGIDRILLAPYPGVLSAIGLLSAATEHEMSAAYSAELAELQPDSVRAALAELDARCSPLMAIERVAPEDVEITYFADVCYIGQSHYLEVPLPRGEDMADRLFADFRREHERVLGHSTDAPAKIVNLRSVHRTGKPSRSREHPFPPRETGRRKPARSIHVIGRPDPADARVCDRAELQPGQVLEGPAILEQPDTTTIVYPGWKIAPLASGNLVLTRG